MVLRINNTFYSSQLKGMVWRQALVGRSWSCLLSSVMPLIKTFLSPWCKFWRFAVRRNLVSAFPQVAFLGVWQKKCWRAPLLTLKMFGRNVKSYVSWRMCEREEFFFALVTPPQFGINALRVYFALTIDWVCLGDTAGVWVGYLSF